MLKFLRGLFGKPKKPADNRPEGYGTDTEFCAEVVRVTSVSKHPNADKLELAQFEMATGPSSYQVVTGKGDFQPGQLGVYFSVDAIVPTAHPSFEFLAKRLDGAGKSHYRLRAARLRGIFSQGLLVRAPDGVELGQFVGDTYGVTYYQPPQKYDIGPTGKTAKVKVQPFPVYTVDSLKKLPTLFSPDEPVFVTEKIHGTNFRFGWVRRKFLGIPFGWKFAVGSHRVMKGGQGGHWYGEDVWSQAALKLGLPDITRSMKGSVFFGELFGHTYTGGAIQDLVYGMRPEQGAGLAVFDIKTPAGWLSPEERLAELERLGLPGVPVLGVYGEGTEYSPAALAEGMSLVPGAEKQIREGVVVESMKAPRRKAKYVSQAYLMRKDA